MNFLLLFPGFIVALIIILLYEFKIRKLYRKLSKSSKNNVHFYVARDEDNSLRFYLGKPERLEQKFMPTSHGRIIRSEKYFSDYGLDANDYVNLKWEDEPVEVFLNLEN